MSAPQPGIPDTESRIAEWRAALARSAAVAPADADELEEHLRDSIADLESGGLDAEEAFLIAVRRLGATDRITAEFAREHGDRLWKQLVLPEPTGSDRRPFWEMIAFAALAVVVIQVARLLGTDEVGGAAPWFLRNLAFLVLPVLGAYFVRVRRVPPRVAGLLGLGVAALAVLVNLYPYDDGGGRDAAFGVPTGQTMVLAAGNLVLVLWFVVLAAYLGGDRWTPARRMDAVRFTGEWIIYYVLIALGGGVLLGLTTLVLSPIAPDAIGEVMLWVVPSGAVAATVVAAWLVESKKSIIENLAPVLTAIFTPLFSAGLAIAAVLYLVKGIGVEFDRDLLVGFDVLLLVVVGLVLYGLSARDPLRPTGAMDVIRLVAVVAAVVLDVLVLVSMFERVGDLGFTPNRLVALGFNLLLVIDLAVTAVLGLTGPGSRPGRMARWQTGFLLAFGAWALFVVVAVPPLFGFA